MARKRFLPVFLVALALAAGCVRAPQDEATPFQIAMYPTSVGDVVPGQFLVLMVDATSADASPITITASADGRALPVTPSALAPGDVAEFDVEIMPGDAGTTLQIDVRGERGGLVDTASLNLSVAPDPGEPPLETAVEVRDQFVRWLATQHPELGINEATAWRASVARPIWLVVSYYTFTTDTWEMGVRWHVMIPPHDWAEIYLRERYAETSPSLAWKIDSRSTPDQTPYAVTPEPDVWR